MKIRFTLLNFFFLLVLVACTSNLSKKSPYSEAIGKYFILQQDLYIYQFNNPNTPSWLSFPCNIFIGSIKQLGNFSYGLPKTVEEKYIGTKNSNVTLKGILWKGTIFTVSRILKHRTADGPYYLELISPSQGNFEGQEIDASDLVAIFDNPPYTKTWSDPPIFKPEYALPLPSDGIWWK